MNRKSRTRSRSRRRVYKGGNGNYSSASTYGTYVNGSGGSQYDRVFTQGGNDHSNVLIGAQGQGSQQQSLPTQQNLSLIQSAGKRRMSRMNKMSRKKRRGGLLGVNSVISKAVTPFALLALQQTYRRNKGTQKYKR